MGYGYFGTFLIVFLTHPGVIIPSTSSIISKATSVLPPDIAAVVPSGGIPPIISGLWQVLWAWILDQPANKSAGLAWTMSILYLIFLFGYMYFFIGLRISAGV